MDEVYTLEQAIEEVGESQDWIIGVEVSIKKWEQIVAGDRNNYPAHKVCGLCLVAGDECKRCEKVFPAMKHLCERGSSVDKTDPRRMLTYLRRSLTRLQKKGVCQ